MAKKDKEKKKRDDFKRPNGYGTCYKLPGKRRRPWIARITTGWEIVDGKVKQLYQTIGYFKEEQEGKNALELQRIAPIPPKAGITLGGLYIEGTFGTGKTHLAATIALYLIEQERRVIFKTADDLFKDIKETFDKDDGSEQKILARYKECDLLIIDDLGKEQATDWTTAQLYAILNDRYENQRPVIITTNFNEDGLIAMESPRNVGEHRIRAILSRLHETTTAMTMTGQDWRSL